MFTWALPGASAVSLSLKAPVPFFAFCSKRQSRQGESFGVNKLTSASQLLLYEE